MKNKVIVFIIIVSVLFQLSFPCLCASAQEEQNSYIIFQDEPTAHALYDKMIETMLRCQYPFLGKRLPIWHNKVVHI